MKLYVYDQYYASQPYVVFATSLEEANEIMKDKQHPKAREFEIPDTPMAIMLSTDPYPW